jgi:nicotinamidase-related amidase
LNRAGSIPCCALGEIDTVVLAGLYTHGCIRATATDAYQKGYVVLVAADCVASTDPQHELVSRQWLEGRVASFLPTTHHTCRNRQSPPG